MAASPHAGTHTEPRFVRKIQQQSHRNVALRFRTGAPSAPAKSIVYVTRPRAKCRRWAKLHDAHRPESPVPGQIAQILFRVGRANDDALAPCFGDCTVVSHAGAIG